MLNRRCIGRDSWVQFNYTKISQTARYMTLDINSTMKLDCLWGYGSTVPGENDANLTGSSVPTGIRGNIGACYRRYWILILLMTLGNLTWNVTVMPLALPTASSARASMTVIVKACSSIMVWFLYEKLILLSVLFFVYYWSVAHKSSAACIYGGWVAV